jgi:hypothetical protein
VLTPRRRIPKNGCGIVAGPENKLELILNDKSGRTVTDDEYTIIAIYWAILHRRDLITQIVTEFSRNLYNDANTPPPNSP